jgi:hypothetical protein
MKHYFPETLALLLAQPASNAFLRRASTLLSASYHGYVGLDEVQQMVIENQDDAERLAALERTARPRLAYAWMQAGGPSRTYQDVTPEQLEAAGRFFQTRRSL